MSAAFDAYVADLLFVSPQAGAPAGWAAALGDGTVRFEGGASAGAHAGAVLCAAPHPSGVGVLTGGDDGTLVWSRADGSEALGRAARGWVDVLAASPASGLVAFAGGREVQVLDIKDPAFLRRFAHERSVAGLAFDPKGRRLAAATYGGAALWYARISDQKPHLLRWAGSHIACAFSPDGRFLISAMQENALHGWRLSDGADLRMGGYPSKPRSLAFLARGALLATSGANGVVLWPFAGASGPMGKEAREIGAEDEALVTRVAAEPAGPRLLAGFSDGRAFLAEAGGGGRILAAATGSPVSALALEQGGRRAAIGREDGSLEVVALT